MFRASTSTLPLQYFNLKVVAPCTSPLIQTPSRDNGDEGFRVVSLDNPATIALLEQGMYREVLAGKADRTKSSKRSQKSLREHLQHHPFDMLNLLRLMRQRHPLLILQSRISRFRFLGHSRRIPRTV